MLSKGVRMVDYLGCRAMDAPIVTHDPANTARRDVIPMLSAVPSTNSSVDQQCRDDRSCGPDRYPAPGGQHSGTAAAQGQHGCRWCHRENAEHDGEKWRPGGETDVFLIDSEDATDGDGQEERGDTGERESDPPGTHGDEAQWPIPMDHTYSEGAPGKGEQGERHRPRERTDAKIAVVDDCVECDADAADEESGNRCGTCEPRVGEQA